MMGQLSAPSPTRHRIARPWPRSRQRRWVRPDDLASVARLFAAIPSLPRAELARLTTRMIDRLDEIDGDPEAEITGEDDESEEDRDPTGDDGCGLLIIEGQRRWGAKDDDPGGMIPIYGGDQSAAPIGQRPAQRRQEKLHD